MASPIVIETAIGAVTVYGDRARVTRQGTTRLAAGSHVLELRNLPTRLLEDSVRVSGRGHGVRIAGIDTAIDQVIEPPEENVAALEKESETLRQRDAALRDEEAAVASRLAMAESLRQSGAAEFAKGLAFGRANLESVQGLAAYVFGEQSAALARKRELVQARADLAKQIEAVNARLSAVKQPAPRQRRRISVALDAEQETALELEVSYLVTGASWTPQYDLRLVQQTVQATYLAGVTQNTGENWQGVALSLSTARPAVTKTVPELNPWYLNIYVPPPQAMAFRAPAPAASAPGSPTDYARAITIAAPEPAPPPPPAAKPYTAAVEASGLAVSYRITKPSDIPSDGSPHRVLIAQEDFPAKLDHITAPKLAAEAYLRATVTNQSNLILLPGKASVFHGDEFTGTTQLENIAPREEFELQLGVDDRVKVERELAERNVSKTFIGNNRRVSYNWCIKLQNLLETAAHLTVLDQIPHSQREEIKVKANEPAPRAAEVTELGVMTWELTMQPGQKSEIRFGYTIEYPRDARVTGLPD